MYIFLIFYFLIFCNANYVYKHVIKTNISSKTKLFNYMREKRYFDQYLNEVKASDVMFTPIIDHLYLHNPQIIEYKCVPKITLYPMKLPAMKIKHIWNITRDKFHGNIITKLIDFNLEIDFLEKENVEIHLTGTINNKSFFIPNFALKYAIYDYESICKKILNSMDIDN